MDRAEATGFGLAVAGHAALLAALTLGLASLSNAPAPAPTIEVSFVDEIGLVSASPLPSIEPPAQTMAPETGPTEDAAMDSLPDPAQPVPDPRPAPPQPQPAPRQAAPTPSRERAAPQPAQERPAPARRQGSGERTRRSLLGDDLLKGIGRDPSPSRSQNPPGAVMSQQAMADIGSAIQRQIQPCADRQVDPGPGANQIVTTINLRLNRDGSLAGRPTVVRQQGINDQNRRYADRVADLAIAAFTGCAPLRGLPQNLYDVPRGWSNFTLNYRLPG